MIKDRTPLSMAEANEILGSVKENDKIKETKAFIKKYSKISTAKAKELRAELEGLNILKMKNSDITKVIEILPENASEVNKIFTEVVLDADETNKIIDAVKKHK
jgi:DNA-directed RNA polymerase subunit F